MAMPLPTSKGLVLNLLPSDLPKTQPTTQTPTVSSLKVSRTELDWAISMASGGDVRETANAAHRDDKTMQMVRALGMMLPAVSQPQYVGTNPTGRLVNGVEGAKMLLDGFGSGSHRTIKLDPDMVKAVARALPMLSRERVNLDLAGAVRTSEERDGSRSAARVVPQARSASFGR